MMTELSDTSQLIYRKNLFLMKHFVYEIRSHDELEIIRRMSHDLKNSLLMQKLILEEYSSEIGSEVYLEKMDQSYQEISEATKMLANFSHIDRLFPEEIDLDQLISDIIQGYSAHDSFHNIELNQGLNGRSVMLDHKLFTIAFRNLLNNALEEISDGQQVKIESGPEGKNIRITISNPIEREHVNIEDLLKSGFTTKEKSSGIGLPIARVIFERHGWEFKCIQENGHFTVGIQIKADIRAEHY